MGHIEMEFEVEGHKLIIGGRNMVEKQEMQEVTVRYCDYCGKKAEGLYSKCDECKKDICDKHHRITSEEESLCYVCAAKRGWPIIVLLEEITGDVTVLELDGKLKKHQKNVGDIFEVYYDGDRKAIMARAVRK